MFDVERNGTVSSSHLPSTYWICVSNNYRTIRETKKNPKIAIMAERDIKAIPFSPFGADWGKLQVFSLLVFLSTSAVGNRLLFCRVKKRPTISTPCFTKEQIVHDVGLN